MGRRIVNLLLILLGAIMTGLSSALALQISPTYQIFELKPGEKTTGEYVVTNNQDENLMINISSKDWFVLPENKKWTSHDWISIPDGEFPLDKGESKKIKFIVQAPAKSQGELVGMLSFSMKGERPTDLNQVMSMAIYVAVKGTENLKADISDFRVMATSDSVRVGVVLKNKGNVHIRPTGIAKLIDEKDQVVGNLVIQQGRPTYPGKQGGYMGELKDFELKKGHYTLFVRLTDMDRKITFVERNLSFLVTQEGQVTNKKL